MPTAVALLVQHGTLTSNVLLDEVGVLVNSLTITPTRSEKLYKGAGGATRAIRSTDPTISFAFSGTVSTSSGFATQHPGTAVSALANFGVGVSRHGFTSGDGTTVYKDVSETENGEDPTQISFTATQFPFMV